jgi:hypothetical protein
MVEIYDEIGCLDTSQYTWGSSTCKFGYTLAPWACAYSFRVSNTKLGEGEENISVTLARDSGKQTKVRRTIRFPSRLGLDCY